MTKYGSAFSATDTLMKAPGQSHDAALRVFTNVFDLAVDGGTSQALKLAAVGPGVVIKHVDIETDANLSGVTLKVGTATDDDAYGAAAAGPNATQQRKYAPLANGVAATSEGTDILLTPSGNLPSSGTIRTTVYASKR